jgi:hypothetical protein
MTTITLPPLPKPHMHNFEGWPTLYSADDLHARDLEVAMLVLAAAASAAEDETQEYENYTGQPRNLAYQCAEAIRNLGVRHE